MIWGILFFFAAMFMCGWWMRRLFAERDLRNASLDLIEAHCTIARLERELRQANDHLHGTKDNADWWKREGQNWN